jgi:hypothetical protein
MAYYEIAPCFDAFLGEPFPLPISPSCAVMHNFRRSALQAGDNLFILRLDQAPGLVQRLCRPPVARLRIYFMAKEKRPLLILTATWADTGSAVDIAFFGLVLIVLVTFSTQGSF